MVNISENTPMVWNYGDGQTFLTVMVTPLQADDKPSFAFSVLRQSKNITKFLSENRYLSDNGLIIAADKYPEFKDSTNHVYLRGSDTSKDFKVDVTRFIGTKQRDAKINALDTALRNFVSSIQNKKFTNNPLVDNILAVLSPSRKGNSTVSSEKATESNDPTFLLIQL